MRCSSTLCSSTPCSRRRTRVGAALALFAALAVVVLAAPAVGAQTTSVVQVSLVSITPQVRGSTDPLRIELRATGASPNDSVRVAILARPSRSGVRQIIEGTVQPTRGDYIPIVTRVSALTDPSRTTLVMSIPNESLPQTAGVYPLQITVGSSKPLITWLVRLGAAAAGDTPYTVSFVVPVRSPVADRPDGTAGISSAEAARLDTVATAIEAAPSGSITVVPNPETLDGLDASGPDVIATLVHLQKASQPNLVLGTSFVPIDVDAWRRAGRDDYVALQFRTGRDTAARTLARSATDISSRTAVLAPTDTPDSLELLRREGAVNVVVPDSQLEPLNADSFPSPFAQTFRVRDAANQELFAASSDSWLSDAVTKLDTSTDSGAHAQQIIADLSAAFFDRPTLARGSVILLPDNWAPTDAVADALFKPLATSPILQLRTLDGYFSTVTRASPTGESQAESVSSGPLRRTLTSSRRGDVAVHAGEIDRARSALASYQAVFGPTATTKVAAFDELLLASSDERLNETEQQAYVDATISFVERSVRTLDGRIAITTPNSERIFMTSRRETIGLVVENALNAPANVRIDLRSEKLSFPGGDSINTTLQPGPNTISFDVAVKTSGDSLLEYTVNAPDGSLGEMAKGKIRVRSIALSGLGVVLSIIAVLVIATWWVRHGMKQRRARRIAAIAEAMT
jgi:hypothetical protein